MIKKLTIPILLLICFSLSNCSKENTVFLPGEEITIPFNKQVTVEDNSGSIDIKFTKLVEESRCPEGMDCIWAGRVIVDLEINGTDSRRLGLSVPGDTIASETVYEQFTIKLISAEYGREKNYGIEEKYSIKLKVE